MPPSHSIRALVSILILLAGSRTHSQVVVPEADRFIKLGTRMEPMAPGEGGQLTVTAPAAFCTDATHLLEVRFFPGGSVRPVVRVPAGPSSCRWEFEGLPAGFYDAIIQVEKDGPVVAHSHGQVWRGATTLMALVSSDVEVEGRLSGELSVPGAVRLVFEVNGGFGGRNRWTAPLNADGTYRVKLNAIDPDDQICIGAQPSGLNGVDVAELLDAVSLKKCTRFLQGLQRLDFDDVHLPPAVVRIEVQPVDDARFDEFVKLEERIVGTPGSMTLRGFKLLRGLRAECFSDYREREFAIVSDDRKTVLAWSRVTPSAEQPIRRVTLVIPRH